MTRITKTLSREISVDETKVPDLKKDIAYIRHPASWADEWTVKAFVEKWRMTVEEAEQLVGRPVWTMTWEDPK